MLLDFATLTGAARVALGPDIAAFFCNNDALAVEIETAARIAHDPVWRMPLHSGYDNWLDGDGCDLKNISDKPYAGAVIAALFLQRFLAPATPWAHFDLYGWNDGPRPGRSEGGEAQCLRVAFLTIMRCLNVIGSAAFPRKIARGRYPLALYSEILLRSKSHQAADPPISVEQHVILVIERLSFGRVEILRARESLRTRNMR